MWLTGAAQWAEDRRTCFSPLQMQCQASMRRVATYCQRGQGSNVETWVCDRKTLWQGQLIATDFGWGGGGVLERADPHAPVYRMSQWGWGQPRLSSFVSTETHHMPCWGGARASIAQGQTFPPQQQGANAKRSLSPDRRLMVTVRIWDIEVKRKEINGTA